VEWLSALALAEAANAAVDFSHPVCEPGAKGVADSMIARALAEPTSPHFNRDKFMHPPD
jgi:hypothetical protein